MPVSSVDILLATYNGARFVEQQIESILRQTHTDWRLLVRDDGSTDATVAICEHLRLKDSRISLVEDGLGHVGLVQNFGRLVAQSSAPYVMYCDQDDVWLPQKLEIQGHAIRKLEDAYGARMPLALFTDAHVVDSELRPIAPSLLAYINRPASDPVSVRSLCLQANCYGCTMVFNRSLAELIGSFPPGAISHDWWSGLAAAVFGRLAYLDVPLVRHRRHSSNASATQQQSWWRYLRQVPSLAAHRRWLQKVYGQWAAFNQRYSAQMNENQRCLFRELASVQHSGWLRRRHVLLRHRLWLTGAGRNLALLLVA